MFVNSVPVRRRAKLKTACNSKLYFTTCIFTTIQIKQNEQIRESKPPPPPPKNPKRPTNGENWKMNFKLFITCKDLERN